MIEQIPVLKIGPILMVSIQTDLHDRMAEDLQTSILESIEKTGSPAVMIDITALEMIDSFIARVLSDTARAARIMNARVVLVGMRPAVTITLLEMGLELPGIETAIDVENGLERLGYELNHIDRSSETAMSQGEEE